jgi:ElaB/YqjD/DUF883 family membrane-anchored ribosome-binding protein
MADYKEKFEEWQQAAKDKFEEIDKQLGLKEKFGEGAKVVKETAQKGAETLKEGVSKIKTDADFAEVGKQAARVAEETVKTAGNTAKDAWNASEPLRNAAGDAGEKAVDVAASTAVEAEKAIRKAGKAAGEAFSAASERAGDVFEDTRNSFENAAHRISNAIGLGASWTRTIDSAIKTARKTSDWITENPLQAATTGVSVVVGSALGAGFTLLSTNWFFNSAVPVYGLKKAGEQFNDYLKKQEDLIEKGDLTQAETEKIQFERDIVKYVGAPLLGAFSFGAGAIMWANIFNPKTITGAPISWILNGNPVLEGVWLFGNGVICFKTGYDFFMIALEDQAEVQRMVKELKGLLPQAPAAN